MSTTTGCVSRRAIAGAHRAHSAREPDGRSCRRASRVAFFILFAMGCTVPSTKLDAKMCPCVSGWVCDERTRLCTNVSAGSAEAGMTDAGPPDAGLDAGAPLPVDGGGNVPDAMDDCPDDPTKLRAGACGCGTPDADRNHNGAPDCLDVDAGSGGELDAGPDGEVDAGPGGETDGGVVEPPQEITLVFESFESPDVETSTVTLPSGWVFVGHPDYVMIRDEAIGTFATPYGQQVLDLYTSTPPAQPASLTTTASKLSATLEADVIYTLTLNVARQSGTGMTGYVVELLAIDDQQGTETVLDSASASDVDTSDMSQSALIAFSTGPTPANLGQRIAVRLRKDPSVDWMSNPLFDNVRLTRWIDKK